MTTFEFHSRRPLGGVRPTPWVNRPPALPGWRKAIVGSIVVMGVAVGVTMWPQIASMLGGLVDRITALSAGEQLAGLVVVLVLSSIVAVRTDPDGDEPKPLYFDVP